MGRRDQKHRPLFWSIQFFPWLSCRWWWRQLRSLWPATAAICLLYLWYRHSNSLCVSPLTSVTCTTSKCATSPHPFTATDSARILLFCGTAALLQPSIGPRKHPLLHTHDFSKHSPQGLMQELSTEWFNVLMISLSTTVWHIFSSGHSDYFILAVVKSWHVFKTVGSGWFHTALEGPWANFGFHSWGAIMGWQREE